MSYDMEIEYEYDSVDDYTDVVFEYQTPRRSNKKLKDLSMSDATANVVKEVPRKGHLSIESSFSVPPGGSGKNSYVVEMEKAEAKKREASLSTYKLDMQQLQHEYEKRLTDMETNMKRAHQLEVEKILAEELSKQLREKSSFESKYNEMEKYHAQTVHELEFHHNERVHDLQQTVEVAKKSYEEKKSLMEKQFSEVQSRVEKQNKDIEARSQSHRAALANREALHKGEVLRRDEHIDRLSAQLRSSNAVVQEMMECMKTAQEVAALIILIHKN
ncbi:LOC106164407, partial [Symbiodinium microadriaticum]